MKTRQAVDPGTRVFWGNGRTSIILQMPSKYIQVTSWIKAQDKQGCPALQIPLIYNWEKIFTSRSPQIILIRMLGLAKDMPEVPAAKIRDPRV
jgi:hypothetical protein